MVTNSVIAAPPCSKHRLALLSLVGDEVQGTCVGCGDRVVLPSLFDASKTLLRVLEFEDRVMALAQLPSADRARAVLNLLPDFADLVLVVESVARDEATIGRVMKLLRRQLASWAARLEPEEEA
jgi:hypothetical protein